MIINVSKNFKNKVNNGICFALTLTTLSSYAYATSYPKSNLESVEINIAEGVNIYVDDKSFTPTNINGEEVIPFIYNGTTYLPIRAIANVFDSDIRWDDESKCVIINTKEVTNLINNSKGKEDTNLISKNITAVRGVNIIIDNDLFIPTNVNGDSVDVYLIEGTTYLPIRAIANVFNTDINWEQTNHGAYIGKHLIYNDTYESLKNAFVTYFDAWTIDRNNCQNTYDMVDDTILYGAHVGTPIWREYNNGNMSEEEYDEFYKKLSAISDELIELEKTINSMCFGPNQNATYDNYLRYKNNFDATFSNNIEFLKKCVNYLRNEINTTVVATNMFNEDDKQEYMSRYDNLIASYKRGSGVKKIVLNNV